ncbi:c2h2 type zinc finger domain-containing protein [Purpureocillium lavendulum]|uniref:ATP-dependent DNA helicase n=1 Tax=Purpureocillium lavendulum TaxID=1247861 RepID=A0AB34FBU1_9HYPO|nr:c2h2 type zinc finger domain-containing protein [Purpureocillium lavendulum]
MPRPQVAPVSPEEIRRALTDIESQRAYQRRPELVRVPHEEILRVLHDMDRQRAEDRARRREARYQNSQPVHPPTTPPRKRPREEEEALPTPPPTLPKRSPKRPRPMRETVQLQQDSVESALHQYETCFRAKEQASAMRSWCNEVPLALQVDAARSFYQAFTEERTLPICHCAFCYRKAAPSELTTFNWRTRLSPSLLQATKSAQDCVDCFSSHEGSGVQVCRECRVSLDAGRLPRACSVNNMAIGCEHRYPEELDGLSPVEERLIALQVPFGYITKFTVDNKTRSDLSYRTHVRGHIVVFPNKVEDLVATVLPHPLLQSVEDIHISWSGSSKPGSADVRHLLQVRKSRVRAALSWLQKNNPLYEHVEINQAEIDGWHYADGSDVPTLIMDRMQREEPSTFEKTQTDHIVPDTDRGLAENRLTSIDELLGSMNAPPADECSHVDSAVNAPPTEQRQPSPLVAETHVPGPTTTDGDVNTVCETSTSGMFPLDGPAAFAEADKLSFLSNVVNSSQDLAPDPEPCAIQIQTAGDQPYIRVERGADFADNLHEDFFPRTFPKLFPWGKGGPKALRESNLSPRLKPVGRQSSHSLAYWTRYVLQRHGGRFATHPVFCFLVFNILLRSSNRRISMVRVAKDSFPKLEQVHLTLTADQLKRAEAEIRETGTTSDRDVSFLLRELSIFGHAQPLSNETRLLMRRKIQALSIWTGMPAIWITINPNDVNNPIKMMLSVHRLHDCDAAKSLLADLRGRYDEIALSIMDPVSSAIFFHREISLFFDKYVKAGKESVFGKISHYYATVETNERGSLHLHGLLWLDGNVQLPSLIDDMANPDEGAYRAQVVRYVDSVFHECLDEDAGKAVRKERKPIQPIAEMMASSQTLTAAFDDESNFIAHCCQVHSHTFTCLKYSLKGLVEEGTDKHRRTACRFKAPWKLVEETGFTDDGLLRIRRNHPLVNRYNKSLAIGLRHNHDVSMILTRTKGLAMVYYITNYATKLDTPMWKRLALAADVARQLRESGSARCRATESSQRNHRHEAVMNESRQFLMRTANRIFSERQLSAVEVCYHLLGYCTDFTNVPHWSFLNLTALYWAIFRQWPHLRHQASELMDGQEPSETVPVREGGRTLLNLDAYAYRGRVLRDLCLYDYMSMIHLVRRKDRAEDESHIALDESAAEYEGWIQRLRRPEEYAVPIFQGFISDDHEDEHPVYIKRNSVLHLALFVPWEDFLSRTQGAITDIWSSCEARLSPRLRFHVSNIGLLRKSAEDARRDARLWASRSEGDDTVDVEYALGGDDYGEEPATPAHQHQNYTALLQVLQSAVRDSDATRGSPVLGGLTDDLCAVNPVEERNPLVQYQQDCYGKTPLNRDGIQAAAKAQNLLHLRMLDETETGSQAAALSTDGADVGGVPASHCDSDSAATHPRANLIIEQHGPRILVDVNPTTTFVEMGHAVATSYTLNYLQSMALQLVCRFLDKITVDPGSAGQHLQHIGGPGGTGKSRIIDALKAMFEARNKPHLLQITGTSGSSAAHIGGTTIHSACGLDVHRAPNKPPPPFSEARKWVWSQKLVLVIDEVSMLGGATLHDVSRHLQALRDCPDEPFGGIPVVLLMGDFHQFAPVLETSLLISRFPDRPEAPMRQATISHHSGCRLWHMFKTVVLLEEQVRARNDPQFGALLDRVRNGLQSQQDLDLLNANIVGRPEIAFHNGLRAITPLNRNRWALNMEAVVDWARFHKRHIAIFVSTHTWRNGTVSQNTIAQTIGQGDDSACKVPGIFFYAQGMPVVVNKNIYTGLKVVNGAEFTAVDIVPDPNHPGYYLADGVTIHFGPPLGILLQSKETEALAIPSLPAGTVLIRPMSHTLDPSNPHFRFLPTRCTRRGLPVAPAFVLTDYKAQGKTFVEVLLELRGNRMTNGEPSKCDFTSLYVQLSRCTTLQGIKLLSPVRPQDFIGNSLDQPMVDGMRRLKKLAAETRQAYEGRGREEQ